jgi:predicted nucleic acid-binding protein
MKLFLDANVIFSASNEVSQLNRLIVLLKQSHSLVTSDYAREEASRNVRAKRPKWEAGFSQLMQGISVVESIDRAIGVDLIDKDRPLLATAIAQQCDSLVTGDKRDFAHLFGKRIAGVTIVTPLMLAKRL